MKIIDHATLSGLPISAKEYLDWIDYTARNMDHFVLPTKVRIPLAGTDYFNVMPCILPEQGMMGLKVVTRNQYRREQGQLNLDAQIMLYSSQDCNLLAIMDGNYITTVRTAAVAVHTALHTAQSFDTVAMVGLGNIGTMIGDLLFPVTTDRKMIVKLYQYKDHAERFMQRFQKYDNLTFQICTDYCELMEGSDVIFSSVTYAEGDFCDQSVYKPGCTVIPVHMRGFMECDLHFDHVITSDLKSIQKFGYYGRFKKMSLLNDVLFDPALIRERPEDRVIVYNLGLAVNDLYYAGQIYQRLAGAEDHGALAPHEPFYLPEHD